MSKKTGKHPTEMIIKVSCDLKERLGRYPTAAELAYELEAKDRNLVWRKVGPLIWMDLEEMYQIIKLQGLSRFVAYDDAGEWLAGENEHATLEDAQAYVQQFEDGLA